MNVMTAFDPYHKWLGIPPDQQPAGPRRLLGISEDENDPQVVRDAALRQTAFVRKFSMGEHGEHADRILSELADARDSILSVKVESPAKPAVKPTPSPVETIATPLVNETAATDRETPQAEPTPIEDPLKLKTNEPTADSSKPPTRSGARSGKPIWQQPWATAAGGAIAMLLIMMLFGSGEETKEPAKTNDSQAQQQIDELKQRLAGAEKAAMVANDNTLVSESGPLQAAAQAARDKSLRASLQQGLVAYYPFNGNANDESGNGNHGVIYGARLASDRHMQQMKAFAFKHGHYIDLPPKLLSQQETLAMAAWCKPAFPDGKKWPRIVGGNGDDLAKNISINIGQRVADLRRRFLFELETEAGVIGVESPEIPVGHWLHVAMVSDGQSLTCFVNGKRIAKETVIEKLVTMKTLTVGAPISYFHYEGSIDDVRIYNRALSAGEVKALYEFEKP
jgi:hypothetical protein